MKEIARMAAIAVAAALFASASARPNLGCTTIAMEDVGRTDHPVSPIIISTSPEDAEWYRQKLFSDPISTFAHVYIVRESTMRDIADIPLPNGNMKPLNSGDGRRTTPILRLVLATGRNSREINVEVTESVSLLGEIQKRVSKYPPIVKELADVQSRMKRNLKQQQ